MMQPNSSKKKTHKIQTKSGGTAKVSGKSVKDAKSRSGAFKEMPSYKGEEVKTKGGKLAGIKTHSGDYMRATGPVARRKASKALEYDRKKYKTDSTKVSQRNQRFREGKKI